MKQLRQKHAATSSERNGAALAEMAVVMPVFFLLVFALVEFGHAYLVINVLNSAAMQAARVGVTEKSTTSAVIERAQEIVEAAIDTSAVTIMVKDASVFDTDPNLDAASINYSSLPDIDLANTDARTLFVVRIELPYDEIGILGPRWLTELTLYGQSVVRHE